MTPELISMTAAFALTVAYILFEIVRQELKLKKKKKELYQAPLLGVVLPKNTQNIQKTIKKDASTND